jgi:two-component system, LytTR family, sensor kinase
MQNPILTNNKALSYYTGIWFLMIGLHLFLLMFSGHLAFIPALTDSVISNMLFSAIGIGLWFPIFFGKTGDEKLYNTIINNAAGAIVAISFWLGVTYFLLVSLFNTDTEYLIFLRKSIPWRAGIGFLYYEVLILVYYLTIFYKNNKENQIKEAELKALIKESELNSLKSQINPHFLFNSLNSISSLTIIEPAKARDMIIKLSEFLRYSISHKEEKFTTLEEEIRNINRYLDIEKIRFGKRMHVSQNIDESCLKLRLPALILQPLLENAVKYGIYESLDESVIELICNCNSTALSIIIRNEWDPDFQSNKGEGIGLKNIRSRLKILYNRDDLFIIRKDQHIFEVNIIFPQN